MTQNLESVTKLISLIEGLSSIKEILNDPNKLRNLGAEAASALALTEKEKATRREYEQFIAEGDRFKERMEKHDQEKTAFAGDMQEQKDAFERLKSEHSKEFHAKLLEVSDRLEAIAVEDKQMKNKHTVLRDELKRKEARLHEHAMLLDDRESELNKREETLARKMEKK